MIGAMTLAAALAASPVDPLRDAVVLVQQGGTTCAGVVLDDGLVATADHCVAGGFSARLQTRDDQVTRARVVARDPTHDLALLEPRERFEGWGLAVQSVAPALGAPIRFVGHPSGGSLPVGFLAGTLRWSLGQGTVAAVGTRSLQLDAALAPGFSGGPVVDDEGDVVGIVSRRIGDGMGFAGRADALSALREQPRRPALGGTVSVAPAGWITGLVTLGAALELTWRERVVIEGRGGVPLGPRTGALLDDEVAATVWMGRLGLRQPFGAATGFTLDAFLAVGQSRVWTSDAASSVTARDRLDPFVGGAVGRGGFRFEVARRIGEDDGARWLLGLRLGLGQLRRVW